MHFVLAAAANEYFHHLPTHILLLVTMATTSRSAARDLKHCNKWGPWKRSAEEIQELARAHALLALQDVAFLLPFVCVLASYRCLRVVKDLRESGTCNPRDRRARVVVMRHVRAMGRDAIEGATIVFLLILQVVTVLSLPAFLEDLPGVTSLDQVIELQVEHLSWIGWYLCRLLYLGLLWDSYVLVVRAATYSILVPPACLAEALRPFTDGLLCKAAPKTSAANDDQGMLALESGARTDAGGAAAKGDTPSSTTQRRFWFGVLVWGGLVVMSTLAALNHGALEVTVPVAGVVGTLSLAFVGTVGLREGRALPVGDFRSSILRVTWPNVLAMASLLLEALQLAGLAVAKGWPSGDHVSPLPPAVSHAARALSFVDAPLELSYVAWAFAVAWAIAITLPLAAADGEASKSSGGSKSNGSSGISSSPLFRHLTHFLGSVSFVSVALVLLPGGSSWQRLGPRGRAVSSCAFLLYSVTTQVRTNRKEGHALLFKARHRRHMRRAGHNPCCFCLFQHCNRF